MQLTLMMFPEEILQRLFFIAWVMILLWLQFPAVWYSYVQGWLLVVKLSYMA